MGSWDSKARTFGGWGHVNERIESLQFEVDVEATKASLLEQEDTDHDGQITIDDHGPKRFVLHSSNGGEAEISGTYQLANLLQELTLASRAGQRTAVILGSRITENPVDRLERMISHTFWDTLTRRLDGSRLSAVFFDRKAGTGNNARIYIPHNLKEQHEYYTKVAQEDPALRLEIIELPESTGPVDQTREMWAKPGLLALNMHSDDSGLRSSEYIVPGGRFNEFYYWDSHFSALGLLQAGKIDLVCDIVDNMRFQIDHYGCVLNANRSYYLGRSQPPFLTDLVTRTYRLMSEQGRTDAKEFLRRGLLSAVKEYLHFWTAAPRLDPETGLSRYRPDGQGIPPEVEKGHFDWFLSEVADKHSMTLDQLYEEYNSGRLQDDELDEFFRHDRAIRESGHDTSQRLDGQAADLATIDLNSLLYKYETDIAWAIQTAFDDSLEVPAGIVPGSHEGVTLHSSEWNDRAARRKQQISQHLWNAESGMFHDYNTITHQKSLYQSAPGFWSLWSGVASDEQARRIVAEALPRFEMVGGLASTPDQSDIPGPYRMAYSHQWDYPFGWAPHQIMLWDGLLRYGFNDEAKRMAYRWLYLLTRIAVDFNGRITERYTVTHLERVSDADQSSYGNQGCDFKGVNVEGFGWTNASYVYGLKVIGDELLDHLRQGRPWDDIASNA